MNSALDFLEVARAVVRGRRTLLWSVAVSGLLGLLLAVFLTPKYEASIVVLPANLSDLRAKGSGLANLSGLADLAGINVGGNDDAEKSIAILESRRFTDSFVRAEGMLPVLFKESWDPVSKSWKRGGSFLAKIRIGVSSSLRLLSGDESPADASSGAGPAGEPSEWDAYRRFNDLREVNRDRKTGLITISIRWKDPVLAAKWANDLIDRVNDDARNIAIRESQDRLAYLSSQLEVVQSTGLRDALITLSVSEQRKAMLAHVEKAYAFQVVDPAVVPGERFSPRRTVLVLSWFVVGAFLGFCIILLRYLLVPACRGTSPPNSGDTRGPDRSV